MFAVTVRPAAHQSQHPRAADEQFHAIVIQTRPRPMPDQARGHRIKYLAQHEATRGGHVHQLLFVIARAGVRKRLQQKPLGIDSVNLDFMYSLVW